jgi:hypothetical protein
MAAILKIKPQFGKAIRFKRAMKVGYSAEAGSVTLPTEAQ